MIRHNLESARGPGSLMDLLVGLPPLLSWLGPFDGDLDPAVQAAEPDTVLSRHGSAPPSGVAQPLRQT